jgi:hypothetical protein
MLLHFRYMLDGLPATMAERRLSWRTLGPRSSQGRRTDGEIMRRGYGFQGRKFEKRSVVERHTIRVEDYSLFGEAVIMNPQQAEVILFDARHDYGLWPKSIGRMSSIHANFKIGHFVQVVMEECVDAISLLDNDN